MEVKTPYLIVISIACDCSDDDVDTVIDWYKKTYVSFGLEHILTQPIFSLDSEDIEKYIKMKESQKQIIEQDWEREIKLRLNSTVAAPEDFQTRLEEYQAYTFSEDDLRNNVKRLFGSEERRVYIMLFDAHDEDTLVRSNVLIWYDEEIKRRKVGFNLFNLFLYMYLPEYCVFSMKESARFWLSKYIDM
jgi:hypothetical protein